MNPRAAINDLLPFQGSPFGLLGTSPSMAEPKFFYLVSGPKTVSMQLHCRQIRQCLIKRAGNNVHTKLICTADSLSAYGQRRRWDSNPRPLSESLVFKTSSLNHSDTSPKQCFNSLTGLLMLVKHFFSSAQFSSFFYTVKRQ